MPQLLLLTLLVLSAGREAIDRYFMTAAPQVGGVA